MNLILAVLPHSLHVKAAQQRRPTKGCDEWSEFTALVPACSIGAIQSVISCFSLEKSLQSKEPKESKVVTQCVPVTRWMKGARFISSSLSFFFGHSRQFPRLREG